MAKEHKPNLARVARETLTGDVRDYFLAYLKHEKNPLPFTAMTEAQQTEIIDKATVAADDLVQRVLEIVAGDGGTAIRATVTSVGIRDKIKALVECDKSDRTLLDLGNAVGSAVMLTVADRTPYEGERAPAVAEPDQPEMPAGK